MGFRGRSRNSGRKENDGKYCRLTGLWPSKKNDALWTGKMRNQDLEKLLEKVEEADKAGADLVVFLWENQEKNGKKDPDFTVQVAVSEDDGNSGGRGRSSRSSGSSRSSRRDRDEEKEEDNEEEEETEETEEEEEEEKPSRRGKSKKEEPRKRSAGSSGKKDKNDW